MRENSRKGKGEKLVRHPSVLLLLWSTLVLLVLDHDDDDERVAATVPTDAPSPTCRCPGSIGKGSISHVLQQRPAKLTVRAESLDRSRGGWVAVRERHGRSPGQASSVYGYLHHGQPLAWGQGQGSGPRC